MTTKKEDEPKSYITASIESKLHQEIMKDARRNETSFSKQVLEYRDYFFAGEEKIIELRTRIRELEQQVDELIAEIKKIKEE